VNLALTLRFYVHPLKVNSSPLNSYHPERKVHFQPSIFQEDRFNLGELLVEKPPAAVVSPAVLGRETSSLRN